MIAGSASGTSTRQSIRRAAYPMPSADSRTSAGTARKPSRMLRTRIVNEYSPSPMTTVVRVRPVAGTSSENSASEGIV